MSALTLCLLPMVLLSLIQIATPTRGSAHSSSYIPRHTPLGMLLRKRSLEAALRGPPTSSLFADSLMEKRSNKRDDGYWIWMPAHGYMPIPRDEISANTGGSDNTGNLLRYG